MLYNSYNGFDSPVENVSCRVVEAWRNCPRKKVVASSVATMFWNLFSVKTRIVAGTYIIARYVV